METSIACEISRVSSLLACTQWRKLIDISTEIKNSTDSCFHRRISTFLAYVTFIFVLYVYCRWIILAINMIVSLTDISFVSRKHKPKTRSQTRKTMNAQKFNVSVCWILIIFLSLLSYMQWRVLKNFDIYFHCFI